jgi:N-6 DNA Methylase
VIEYEKPRSMRQASKREEAVQQVFDYLTAFTLGSEAKHQKPSEPTLFPADVIYSQAEEEHLAANVGLASDGEQFVFIQRHGKQWHTETHRLNEDMVEKLLLWLRAMSRKDLSPENLIADFGPQSSIAAAVVGVLAKLVHSQEHPKANVIYEEWRRIFGIVYGTEQLRRTRRDPEAKALASAYQLDLGVDFPVLLFAIHTYYALLMKLLATEVIVAQGGLGDTFIGALGRGELRSQLTQLESGEILQRQNVKNAIEQDFFGWYPEAWTSELHEELWHFAQTLAAYDIGTFQIKPDRARDLLKDLYHGLIPEAVRHALGEYYTPDWLAEHTINLAGYDGDPHKTFLDPACGSGTFLIMAIHKVRQWLTDQPVEWGSNAKKLEAVNLIRHNIVGFDLNPLAVIASRTNYLFALGPLLRYRGRGVDFEIPVYLTDSVLLPGRTDMQPDLFFENTIPFPMTVGTFNLPVEVVETRQVPDLMNLLHECIAEDHSRESFVNRSIRQLRLTPGDKLCAALRTLFDMMKNLDRQGKNRVWAKLIRNRYAALFFRHCFDFVVGNPPHVNWEALTPEWRKAAEEEYRHYGLFTLKGLESRHGGGKKDIAALFTYAVMGHFVKDGGVLALVMHVSLFKTSGAGEGYRRFKLGTGQDFCIEEAHDFQSFQPFQTYPQMRIKTRTLTFRAVKGRSTKYPVPYTVWKKVVKGFVPGSLTWDEAQKRLQPVTIKATPLRGTSNGARLSPWLTVPASKLPQCRKVIASTNYEPCYEGHAGIYTGGLNGAYFLEVLDRYPNGTVLIRNRHDVGKIKVPKVQATIEADLVYPLLRGRSIARWWFEPEGHVLIVQDPNTQCGYPESWMQETHPLTWSYLKRFEKLLRARKAFKKFFDPNKDPFYSMYDISHYTFAQYKVVWMDVSATMKATVLTSASDNEMPIPEHKLMLLITETADEAHYVAAVLNSEPVNTVIAGYIVDNSVSTHPIENIIIPKFDPTNVIHIRLASLSNNAHQAAAQGDDISVKSIETAINQAVRALW